MSISTPKQNFENRATEKLKVTTVATIESTQFAIFSDVSVVSENRRDKSLHSPTKIYLQQSLYLSIGVRSTTNNLVIFYYY